MSSISIWTENRILVGGGIDLGTPCWMGSVSLFLTDFIFKHRFVALSLQIIHLGDAFSLGTNKIMAALPV